MFKGVYCNTSTWWCFSKIFLSLKHAHARMHARTQSCLQNKFLLAPLTLSHHSFDPRLRRVGGHVLLEGTTQSVHASAVTMKEEQINFGCVSLCSGHGLFENNQGKCAQQTMQAWKKTHTVRNIEWLNLGLNTMVTGHTELIVIFLNPFWELHTWKRLVRQKLKEKKKEKSMENPTKVHHVCTIVL